MSSKYALLCAAMSVGPVCAYDPAGTPDDWPAPVHEPALNWQVLGDRLETSFGDGADGYQWDVQGWYGGDFSRLWIKSEGEGTLDGDPGEGEAQVLYSRLFAPFWDWQAGVRHDFRAGPERTYAVLGVQGMAPYAFEVDSALFVSEHGEVSARIEIEYDLLLSQRWVVQPRLELNAAFSEDRAVGVGAGLNNSDLGVRLRYHLRREIAPYIGVSWTQRYGETGRLAGQEGTASSEVSLRLGVQIWF